MVMKENALKSYRFYGSVNGINIKVIDNIFVGFEAMACHASTQLLKVSESKLTTIF